ncbi:hypothetical protein ZOSMA_1G00520 [Zostera marina]|uniref:Uncharacterized protein n=1 Tax=Zostera marina TaxID=29655 RepID=A0A0K9PM87_ZOSMR|nr:hypothetical protein ZOSMA_1G00520 [Zostera marina]
MSTIVVAPVTANDSVAIMMHRNGAETFSGDSELCKMKMRELLEGIKLPLGLLPLEDIVEVGVNRDTRFVWLKQKQKMDHTFKKIGKRVWYSSEVTAFVDERRMTKITGVKTKELLLSVTVSEMFVDEKEPEKITFKTPSGLFRSFAISAFDLPTGEK